MSLVKGPVAFIITCRVSIVLFNPLSLRVHLSAAVTWECWVSKSVSSPWRNFKTTHFLFLSSGLKASMLTGLLSNVSVLSAASSVRKYSSFSECLLLLSATLLVFSFSCCVPLFPAGSPVHLPGSRCSHIYVRSRPRGLRLRSCGSREHTLGASPQVLFRFLQGVVDTTKTSVLSSTSCYGGPTSGKISLPELWLAWCVTRPGSRPLTQVSAVISARMMG